MNGLSCPHCGYDLAGLGSTTCPECGGTYCLVASTGRSRVRRRWLLVGLVGVGVALGGLAWSLGIESIGTLLWWPALVAVLVGAVCVGIAAAGGDGTRAVWRAGLGVALSGQERGLAGVWLLSAAAGALACGAIGSLSGVVALLRSFDDPTLAGPGLSISLIALLYGLVLAAALACTGAAVSRQVDGARPSGQRRFVAILLLCIALAIGLTLSWAGAVLVTISHLPPTTIESISEYEQ